MVPYLVRQGEGDPAGKLRQGTLRVFRLIRRAGGSMVAGVPSFPPMKSLSLSAAATLLATLGSAHAVVLVADFNDLTTGQLSGKAGGTGFSGSWTGSANPQVSTTNLTSSLYNVPQSGTAQSVVGNNSNDIRQDFRTVATSPAGEVWFSFLAQTNQNSTSTDSAGISLNAPTGTPFNNRGNFYVQFTGTSLVYNFGAGETTVASATSSGATNLIVGRMIINPAGASDTVTLWINPNLTLNPDINTYTPVYNSSSVNALDSITTLGLIAYREGTGSLVNGGRVDNIRFSDGGGNAAQAYLDVTNIPEPSALLLAAGGLGCALARRKRRD